MAIYTLTNCTAWVDELDVSTLSNKLTLKASTEVKDATTFAPPGVLPYKTKRAGLRSVAANLSGFQDLPNPDASLYSNLGSGVTRVATLSPQGAETNTAYFFQGNEFGYEVLGDVGEIAPFTLDMEGTNKFGLIRGQVARSRGAVLGTGPLGQGVQLPIGATGLLYASLHLFLAGTTITVQIQSDDSSLFISPTVVATIGPLTAAGGTFMVPIAHPFFDEWFRFNVSGVTGVFDVAGAIAA